MSSWSLAYGIPGLDFAAGAVLTPIYGPTHHDAQQSWLRAEVP
ncbi:hypothetical protein AB0J80_13845 [Actinoplanes sp. NPDC049548]